MPRVFTLLPDPDTLLSLLLTLVALSGEFPSALVSRLPGADTYNEFAVKRLKRKNLLRSYSRDGLYGLRLTTTAKKRLLSSQPDHFQTICTGLTEPNTLKSDFTRRLRLHRMAEVLVTMNNAGVLYLPWEKPAVFQPEPLLPEPYISQPVYYSSREIKDIGLQSNKIRGSRSTGILLTDGCVFMIYNTANSQMKWEYQAEKRLKALLQFELCRTRLPAQFMDAAISGIVFGNGMEQMDIIMGAGGKATHNRLVLDRDVEHFYYLTNDHKGEVILQLLCNPERKGVLDMILMENLFENRPDCPVENDAIDDTDSPVLFGYTCDMPRIRRFDTGLELHEMTGTLICFDFQEEILRRICGPQVKLQSIDFDSYERSVFHLPQGTD